MTDFEQFELHWNRAADGLVGRIIQDSRAVYTRSDINAMWREELISNRFCPVGLRDGAQIFLEELFDRRPDTAKQLQDRLQASRLEVGIEVKPTALKGAAAVGSAMAAGAVWNSGLAWAARVAGTTMAGGAAACLAGNVAAGVGSATKQAIIRDIRAEAQRQVEGYRALLDS